MSNRPRPVLLGYVRAGVPGMPTQVERAKAQLVEFADREEFSLGTVYVEWGTTAAAFHSLMAELTHDDSAWGVLVPDLRHLTDRERQVLEAHDQGVRTRIIAVGFIPLPRAAEPEPPAPSVGRNHLAALPAHSSDVVPDVHDKAS